jgi:hypothetical protein
MRPSGSRILVVRHLFAAAIGMTLFLIVIWLILRMAVWVAVRQRAMRPGYV